MRLGISDDVSGMYITISTRVAEDQENAELNFSCDECTARTAVGKGGKKSLLCDAGSELRLGRELEWNHEDNKIGWDKKKKKIFPPGCYRCVLGGTIPSLSRGRGQLQYRGDCAHDVQERQLVPNRDLREQQLEDLVVRRGKRRGERKRAHTLFVGRPYTVFSFRVNFAVRFGRPQELEHLLARRRGRGVCMRSMRRLKIGIWYVAPLFLRFFT